MATIHPFRGVRYNKAKVGDLSNVVTPPYDVISAEAQEWYRRRHPESAVRLILPVDDGCKYKNSAACLNEWLSLGALERDAEPSIYAVLQEFEVAGEKKRRLGFSCAVRLEDYENRTVLPHENILAKPMGDRLNLMQATKSNFDSVFGLYSNSRVPEIIRPFTEREPDACAVDQDGVVCKLWKISDAAAIKAVQDELGNESILIADGHHRYAAALAYRNQMRQSAGKVDPDAPYESVMMTLVSLSDSGLVVLPTHRLVGNVAGFNPEAFLLKLKDSFDVTPVPASELASAVEGQSSEKYVFGLYLGGGQACVLKLKPFVKPESVIDTPASNALKQLDVSVLHSIILEKLLGIGAQEMSAQSNLSYTRNPEEAMRMVDDGSCQMLFLVNSTRVDEVDAVAAAGDKMPQKSTFFYPKLITGLLMRVMEF